MVVEAARVDEATDERSVSRFGLMAF